MCVGQHIKLKAMSKELQQRRSESHNHDARLEELVKLQEATPVACTHMRTQACTRGCTNTQTAPLHGKHPMAEVAA